MKWQPGWQGSTEQLGWSRKHRSNPKVSEHFLDKDRSIQRQITFNDATGAEKQPREQLISWWHITAAGSWNCLGKVYKEGHKRQERLGDNEGHKARRGQAEWPGWTLVYKHRCLALALQAQGFSPEKKSHLTGGKIPHKAERKYTGRIGFFFFF